MSNKTFVINDVTGYVTKIRFEAANSIIDQVIDLDNLDKYITIPQLIKLLDEYSVGKDSTNHPLINEDANEKIFYKTATWIYNVALASLAAAGQIECAWSTKENKMIFWNEPPTNIKDEADYVKPKRKRRKNL